MTHPAHPVRTTFLAAVVVVVSLLAAACSSESAPDEIVLLTHDSFALSDTVLDAFTEETGVTIVVTTAGDAGTMLNQAILTKDNPIADVIFGVDNAFISRAIDNDLFLPYRAEAIDTTDQGLRMSGDFATPMTFGDVCINYHIEGLAEGSIAAPSQLLDLVNDDYRDRLVVEDPATSSPGLAFLMATVQAFPEDVAYTWQDYWRDLFVNGVSVASDWSEAYYSEFSQNGGDRPLVVSYASSPPAEVFFGEVDSAPTGSMTEGCFRQIEYAGILKGTEHASTARQLIDFLLSPTVQNDIPLNMFVYPANGEAILPEVFVEFTAFPNDPVVMDPSVINENRERWIQEWTAIARS
jgi:thiamine transport system substrate-binding protein